MKRLLAHGDLRFVVLLLIEEKPRHGYELIKLIESKSSHQYSPSPGVIYPTLTYLEETGLVTTTVRDDKKQYSITPEGVQHLEDNRALASGILKRLEEMGAQLASAQSKAASDSFDEDERSEIKQAFHAIKAELKGSPADTLRKNKKQILEILERALEEIRSLKV
jgi:DNA-binding PadR family transcriptional regulator